MKSEQKSKITKPNGGLETVPKNYHTLIVELSAHQAFNVCPTTVRTTLYYVVKEGGKPKKFLQQSVRYTDQPASLAIGWQFKYLRGIFRVKNKIERPKKVIIRIHNLLTYLTLTGQLTEVYEYEQRTLRGLFKKFLVFCGNPICDVEYVSDKNNANRFLDQSRGFHPYNINATQWDTGEKYFEIFRRSIQNRKE